MPLFLDRESIARQTASTNAVRNETNVMHSVVPIVEAMVVTALWK